MTACPRTAIIDITGAGKTCVGKEVAYMLYLSFVDANVEIGREVGMKIPSCSEEYGEPAFREIGADLTTDMPENFDGIFSLGGGTPMTPFTQHALVSYIGHGGRVVYLDVDPAKAMERVNREGGRSMLNGNANSRRKRLSKQRGPIFREAANAHVHTRGLTPQDAMKKAIDMILKRVVHITGAAIEPYDVVISEGAMSHLVDVLGPKPAKIALIHAQPVQRHSDCTRALLRQGDYEAPDIVIPDAEPGETIIVANGIWERPDNEDFTRPGAVVGLGGGAAADLASFVTATWARSVYYINCLTLLLAMVDTSTGGKTGINTLWGKSLVGSFYTPAGMLADTKTSVALLNDIFIKDLGEVAESGFIRNPEILYILEDHAAELRTFDGSTFLGSPLGDVVAELIERTVKAKAYRVSPDLKEKGPREFLNYGHTVGHAIGRLEHLRWRHGSAVAVGMVCAAGLVHLIGHVDQDLTDYHRSLLASMGLPTLWNGGSFDDVLVLTHRDERARGNELRFVVLDEIGRTVHLDSLPAEAMEEALRHIQQ